MNQIQGIFPLNDHQVSRGVYSFQDSRTLINYCEEEDCLCLLEIQLIYTMNHYEYSMNIHVSVCDS